MSAPPFDQAVELLGSFLAPLDGGTPITLATLKFGSGPCGITVDDTNVSLGGGSPTTLSSHLLAQPIAIAVDGTSVYWTDFAYGSVMKISPK